MTFFFSDTQLDVCSLNFLAGHAFVCQVFLVCLRLWIRCTYGEFRRSAVSLDQLKSYSLPGTKKKKKKKKRKKKEDAHKNVEERRIDYGLFLTF